jgi:hypothetical protein
MVNLLTACQALIADAHEGLHYMKIDHGNFALFKAAVEQTTQLLDPAKVMIILPESAWNVLSETLVLDAESAHIDPELREEIQAALDTLETVQLLATPSNEEEAAAAFGVMTDALALPAAEVTP